MYIDKNGDTWFKGNLHVHTKISDGRLQPEEVCALYKQNGYDFMTITDHWKYSVGGVDEASGLTLFPGCEYHTGNNVVEGIYHIVSAFADHEPVLVREGGKNPPVQVILDAIKEAGGMAILAHPAWSLDNPAEIEKLRGLDAAEIYNTVSAEPWNVRPYSGVILDRLYADGMMLGCSAADDAHFYNGDACVSFVYVRAKECTRTAIRDAMLARDFIATQGPFLTLKLEEDGHLTAETDVPVKEFRFMSNLCYVHDRICRDESGSGITHCSYPTKKKNGETFVRCEAVGLDGRCAWSNPVIL